MPWMVLLACLALAACAPAPKVDEAELAKANQQADLEALKSQMQRARTHLEDIENRLGPSGDSGVTLEDLNNRVARLEQSMNRVLSALSMSQSQPSGGPGGPSSQDSSDSPAPAQESQDNTPADPAETIFNLGMQALNAHNYDRAASIFQDMVKTYPTDRRVPRALLMQAEAYLQQNDPARSALVCQDLIQKYPNSPEIPQAMLKQGLSFKRLGRNQPAKIVLEDLVKRFAGTAEAKIAQQQLSQLR